MRQLAHDVRAFCFRAKDVITQAENWPAKRGSTLVEYEGRRPGQVPPRDKMADDPPNDVLSTGRPKYFARGQLHLFRIQRGATFVKLPERDALGRAR